MYSFIVRSNGQHILSTLNRNTAERYARRASESGRPRVALVTVLDGQTQSIERF